jgi:putative transposase
VFLTPFTSLTWAYQLHYYLCFRTHRRLALLKPLELKQIISEICGRHEYHLLEWRAEPAQLLCLITLQPAAANSKVIQILKCNSSRDIDMPRWGRGYLARSVGRAHIATVQKYLERQSQHHGYDARILPPVYCYRACTPVELAAAHCSFELSHQLVFATSKRKGVFNSTIGRRLGEYWLRVAAERGFAIDQMSVVPDHVHLIVRIVPSMSIETCALLLLKNGQYFMGKNYSELLVKLGMDQLWEGSAYAGTCGEFTTAFVKAWLRRSEGK